MAPLCNAAFPDNYRLQIITKRSLLDGEMHSTICVHVEWAADHFGLGLFNVNRSTFDKDMGVPVTLTIEL